MIYMGRRRSVLLKDMDMKNPSQNPNQKTVDKNTLDATTNANVFVLPSQEKETKTSSHEIRGPRPLVLDDAEKLSFPVEALGQSLAHLVFLASSAMQIPEGLFAMSVLGAINYCVQGLFNVAEFGHFTKEPCSEFFIAIAKSGEGKSRADALAFLPINDWERSFLKGGAFPVLEIVDPLNPASGNMASAPGVASFSDTTIPAMVSEVIDGNYPSIALRTDEGGGFFGGFSMKKGQALASQSVLTKAFDTGDFTRNRLSDKDGSGVAHGRRLTMFISIQPSVFAEAASSGTLCSQGLFPRFLITEPKTMIGERVFSQTNVSPRHSPEFLAYQTRLNELLSEPIKVDPSLSVLAAEVKFTQDAIDETYRIANEHEKECGIGGLYSEELLPFAARKVQHIRRLATTLAVYYKESEVNVFRVQCAEKIVQHSLDTWVQRLGRKASEAALNDAQELYDWLVKKSTSRSSQFKLREMQRGGPNKLRSDSARLIRALVLLSQYDWLTLDEKNTVTSIQRV